MEKQTVEEEEKIHTEITIADSDQVQWRKSSRYSEVRRARHAEMVRPVNRRRRLALTILVVVLAGSALLWFFPSPVQITILRNGQPVDGALVSYLGRTGSPLTRDSGTTDATGLVKVAAPKQSDQLFLVVPPDQRVGLECPAVIKNAGSRKLTVDLIGPPGNPGAVQSVSYRKIRYLFGIIPVGTQTSRRRTTIERANNRDL